MSRQKDALQTFRSEFFMKRLTSESLTSDAELTLTSVVPRPHTLENYLQDRSDPRLSQRLAAQSRLPDNSLGYHGAAREGNQTSMMMTGGDHTRDSWTEDLAGLTSGTTRSNSESIPTSVGARGTEPHRLLEGDPGNALRIPRLRAHRILECPFNFLECIMTFRIFDDWFKHSLEHFGDVGPSTSNGCCFCDETFNSTDGMQSWRNRMQHLELHHQLGHRLATARPSFQLYDYLWNKKLISTAVYKNLKGNSPAAYASPYTKTHSNRPRDRR